MSVFNLVDYIGVLIGGAIGLSGSIIVEWFKGRREEKQRREDSEQKRLDAAHEYFRNNYDAVKPFLRAYTKVSLELTFIGLLEVRSKLPLLPIDNIPKVDLSSFLDSLLSSTINFINEGYAALFPERLIGRLFLLQAQLVTFQGSLKDQYPTELDEKQLEHLNAIYKTAKEVKDIIRYALNVDALKLE